MSEPELRFSEFSSSVSEEDMERTADGHLDPVPYLKEAFSMLKSTDPEGDRDFLLDDLRRALLSWGCEGEELRKEMNTACFLLWALISGMSDKKLSPVVNDLPGIVLTTSFHALFRKHMDEGRDLRDNVRFVWHHTLFRLYQMAWEESGETEKGFLMLTQAFAMSEIHVNRGMWKEAEDGLRDTISFGEELGERRSFPWEFSMLMGIASFYLGFVLWKAEEDREAMHAYYREALDWLSPIPEDFNADIPEVMRLCSEELQKEENR